MNVRLGKNFRKKFKKIPKKMHDQFYERVDLFLLNKFDRILNNHSVDPTFPNCRSFNISGDYRVIFEEHGDTVVFVTIGTHSELY